MTSSKISPTIVAISSYAIMAGFFTQSGVILAPAAVFFGRSVPDTAGIFSFLLGGNLLGIIASLFVLSRVSLRTAFAGAYAVLFAGIALLSVTRAFPLALLAIAMVGFGGGLGLSGGAVIISKLYAANQRAIAFLGTDCAFSIAGFIFPAIAGLTIAHGFGWPSGYYVVAATAALVLVGTIWVRFPPTRNDAAIRSGVRADSAVGAYRRIACFGGALALYLAGQSVFLLWAPGYLESIFAVPALEAGRVVSSFWGPSIFGLITAALAATRIAPRGVLVVATSITVGCLVALATTTSSGAFYALTVAFGFSSTCIYKLMISIGSEQLVAAPPQLITFLLLSGSIGGTLAPFVSAQVVRAFGPHAGPYMTLGCYGGAFALILIALASERSTARVAALQAGA